MERDVLYLAGVVGEDGSDPPPDRYDEVKDPLCTHKPHEKKKGSIYGKNLKGTISVLYIAFVILWMFLFCYLRLYDGSLLMGFLFILPLIFLFLSFCSLNTISRPVEEDVFRTNIVTAGILVSLPLMGFLDKNYTKRPTHFFRMFSVAIILVVLSMVPVWTPEYYLPVVRHFRTGLQTEALGILIIGLGVLSKDFNRADK